ncbi:MAG TPA: hypothetical protein VML96_08705, partial [Egibacteraceae bacterium]|nr:hypothetical protein [Egibacteraceae bacterium]
MSVTGGLCGLLLASAMLALPAPAASQAPDTSAAARQRALAQATAALEAGRRAEAKALLAAAADRFESVQALLQLARLQSGEGDAAGALATLDRARVLAPNAEEVLSATAQVSLASRAPV